MKSGSAFERPRSSCHSARDAENLSSVHVSVLALPPCKLRSGKTVHAWAVEVHVDVAQLRSNTFAVEWPPGSGATATFPEVDRYGWFDLGEAAEKINARQRPWLDALASAARTAG